MDSKLENAKNFFIDKIEKPLKKNNHEIHSDLFEKHINFTPTNDGLNASIKNFAQYGKVSGTFMQNLKLYAEEYHKICSENKRM